jgi:hypothetical protein
MSIKVSNKQIEHLKINHSPVIQTSYIGQDITKDKVKKLVKEFQQKYGHKNITLMVSVNTPLGFRSAKQFQVNEEPILPDETGDKSGVGWNMTDSFVIYAWRSNPTRGGDDEFNDCLFNCIHSVIGTYKMPKDTKTPEILKQYLKLKRNDKIDISTIPKVEDFYKININVNGDYSFISSKKYKLNIPLLLIDGHYSVDEESIKIYSLLNNIPKITQKLVVCYENKEKVDCYDGNYFSLSYEEYNKEKQNLLHNERVFINELEKDMDNKDKTTFCKTKPEAFIERYCSKLNINSELTKLAQFIAIKIEKNNIYITRKMRIFFE